MKQTKTASLKVTLSIVNEVFRKRGKERPFQVDDIEVIQRFENASHVPLGEIAPPYTRTKLFDMIQKRIDEEALPRERLHLLGKALFDCKFRDPRAVQALPLKELLPYVNAKLPKEVEPIDIGEIVLIHMATDPKTSAAYKETKLAPTTKLAEQYDDTASKEDPIGVSVRVVQGVIATMWRETGVSPFELASAIDGSNQLHPSHDKLLGQLVTTNFTAAAVKSALKGARTTEAWTATGVDNFIEAVLFVCNYPLRAIIRLFRTAGARETFTSKDPSVIRAQTREYDTLLDAFKKYWQDYSFYAGLEGLAEANEGLREKINDLLKEARILSADEIHDKVMTEYRSLDPDAEAGDVFAAEEEASMSILKVDSGADATIVKPGVIRKSDLKPDKKTWGAAGRTSFLTSHSGKVKGSVKWNTRNKEETRRGETSFQVQGHVSDKCKDNLLSLESLFESDKWKFATFQLDKEGKSYLYGADGKRVPLARIAGKKGWWIKVHHGDCKSEICPRVYGLIRVLGKPNAKDGPLDRRTRSTTYINYHNSIFTTCDHSPYDRSQHLSPHELDIYDQLPNICGRCHPNRILGTLTLGTSPIIRRTKPISKKCNLYATGLHESLTEADVNEMFNDFGRIIKIEFPAHTGGKPRSDSALVAYRKPHEARRAHNQMRGFQMWGKAVKTSLESWLDSIATNKSGPNSPKQVEDKVTKEEAVNLVEYKADVGENGATPDDETDVDIRNDEAGESIDNEVGLSCDCDYDPHGHEVTKEEVVNVKVTKEEAVSLRDNEGDVGENETPPDDEIDVDKGVRNEGDVESLETEVGLSCDGDHDPRADGHEEIERTVTAKAIHLRLGSSYYERAKKAYQGKDKITLTDVGEVFQLHEIYNHRSLYVLRQMFRIELPAKYSGFACDACDAGKMARTNSHKVYSQKGNKGRDLQPGEEWHMDLMFFPKAYGQRKGHIVSTRVDGESRASDTAIIRSKDKTLTTLQLFISRSATGKPSRIRVDRGWEYLNSQFRAYCTEQGIELKPSAAYQHGQMGIAERFNRTIKEHVLSSLLARNTDFKWWPEALHHENYIYNRTAHSGIEYALPVERESGKPTDTWNIKGVFGCAVKVKKNPESKAKALEAHFRPGKFLGIAPNSSMGTYRVLMLDTNKVVYTAHVIFENLVSPAEIPTKSKSMPMSWFEEAGPELSNRGQESPLGEQVGESPSSTQGTTSPDSDFAETWAESVETMTQPVEPQAQVYTDTPIATRDEESDICSSGGGERTLRDRSTLSRPDYFIESAPAIYAAPQLASKPSGQVLSVRWRHPLIQDPIPPVVRHTAGSRNCTEQAEPMSTLYGRPSTITTDGSIMLVESVLMEVVAEEQTGQNAEIAVAKLSDVDNRKQRIAELREEVKRNPEEEADLGPPPESYKNVAEALSETNPYRARVKAAMELEILTLYVMGTFDLRPDGEYSAKQRLQKRIGTKWVITVKETVFRARLVVLGYMQDKSRMYLYSPTLRRETTRQIFAKAAKTGNQLRSLDIRNAFIREKATSEVFLLMPKYLRELLGEDLADVRRVRLGKMLYGMADSPVVFYNGLDRHLKSHDMRRSLSDPCHFRKRDIDVGFHVDDGVYTGTDDAITSFERHMRTYYELKDVGVCDTFTGLRAIQTTEGVYVHQIPYIRKLVREYLQPGMDVEYSRKATTPMEEKLRLTPPTEQNGPAENAKHLPYKELRCSLMWVAYGSRPDICYAISVLGSFDHCYDRTLYKYLLRVLKYLQGTQNKCILYKSGSNEKDVESYVAKWPQWSASPKNGISADASCLTPEDKFRGRGGFIVMCNSGPIAWNSYTLKGGAKLGSYEAEFKNLSNACKEGARLQDSLIEFDLLDVSQRFPVVCDNTTALHAMERPAGASKKLGHIEKFYYFVQDKIKTRMKLGHLHSEFMPADILTKPLGGTQFAKLRDMLLANLPDNYTNYEDKHMVDLR